MLFMHANSSMFLLSYVQKVIFISVVTQYLLQLQAKRNNQGKSHWLLFLKITTVGLDSNQQDT